MTTQREFTPADITKEIDASEPSFLYRGWAICGSDADKWVADHNAFSTFLCDTFDQALDRVDAYIAQRPEAGQD